MSNESQSGLAAAMALNPSERAELVVHLLDTLTEADDDEIPLEKLERRFANKENMIPWEQVRDQA